MKLSIAPLATALAFGALAAPAVAAPADLVVDDDRQQCRKATHTTISSAVAAAPAGATIRVCAGTYDERVTITKPLVVEGPRRGNAASAEREDLAREAVVLNRGDGGFVVQGTGDVTVAGFTVLGAAGPAANPEAGVVVDGGAGHRVLDNVLRGNSLGVRIQTTGTEIAGNLFAENNRATAGNVNRSGIFGIGALVQDLHVHHNAFRGHVSNAINLGGAAGSQSTGLVVEHNRSERDGTFLTVGRQRGAVVAHNHATALVGGGVFGFGELDGLTVAHNTFTGTGAFAASGVNLARPAFGATRGATDAVVEHNDLSGFSFRAVRIGFTTGFTVAHNKAYDNLQEGIDVDNSTGGTIARNDVTGNLLSGIRLQTTALDNLVEKNDVRGNGGPDCDDRSAGTRTAGTANTWQDNRADDENRPGLCLPAQD